MAINYAAGSVVVSVNDQRLYPVSLQSESDIKMSLVENKFLTNKSCTGVIHGLVVHRSFIRGPAPFHHTFINK
jgi:hypothetical protein